jgi:hypothetical protein
MRNVFVRYQAKPDRVEENRSLIEKVFAELAETQPDKLRYMVLEFEDGSFVHCAVVPGEPEAYPLRTIAAFRAVTADAGERQSVKSVTSAPRIVGNYRMIPAVNP